jgi:hypothetical protein
LNCGDVIVAAPGNYTPSTNGFQFDWGKVTGTGHCVARLTCATFDACKFIADNGAGISIQTSHWMVDGWEATATTASAICFEAYPATSAASIQDIIFANDIANGCNGGGFAPIPNGSAGVDYFVLIGDIAYNAAQETAACASGISIWEPVNTDTAPGTHIYISQTFTWGNVDPGVCAGRTSTDGEGIIFDTWSANSYTGQGVIENNLSFFNGSLGIEIFSNSSSQIYVLDNTAASNDSSTSRSTGLCGEIGGALGTPTTEFYQNVARTNAATACGGNAEYAYVLQNATASAQLYSNFGFSAAGNSESCQMCTGFSFGPNEVLGTDPMFANLPTTVPSAPSCDSASSVINCMAPIIADFTPTSSAVPEGWGYQPPSQAYVYDPLFPEWLCNVNLPSGLVSMGCLSEQDSSNQSRPVGTER